MAIEKIELTGMETVCTALACSPLFSKVIVTTLAQVKKCCYAFFSCFHESECNYKFLCTKHDKKGIDFER